MDVLQAHQGRVKNLSAAMDRLAALHDRLYALWEEIVHLQKPRGAPHEVERLEKLHADARGVAEEIASLSSATFGSLRHASELNLKSQVESLPLRQEDQAAA